MSCYSRSILRDRVMGDFKMGLHSAILCPRFDSFLSRLEMDRNQRPSRRRKSRPKEGMSIVAQGLFFAIDGRSITAANPSTRSGWVMWIIPFGTVGRDNRTSEREVCPMIGRVRELSTEMFLLDRT